MKDELLEFFSVEADREFELREICGFTFVFEKNVLKLRDEMVSAEIRPAAIIYEENGEYYLAPLYDKVKISPIVKKYVEKFL